MRKSTLGRKYYHKPVSILKGHSIMISVGSPNNARKFETVPYEKIKLINGNEQFTNRLAYIPFERTKVVSGKKSRESFEKDLELHWKKVNSAIDKFNNKQPLGQEIHYLADITKTSKIIRY